MIIENHFLKDTSYVETPNIGGSFSEGLPDTIVIHYTAGGSAESSIQTLTNPNIKASAHVVVSKDGTITQLAPFNTITWHAGKSSHLDRTGINQYSIGIEIDNAGLLSHHGEKYFTWFGKEVPASHVVKAIHRNQKTEAYWERYTEEQITTVQQLCQLLKETYDIVHIVGHEEISPGRKIDPGPAFPLDKLRNQVLQANRDENEGFEEEFFSARVTASALNIREQPSKNAPKIAQPLSKNTLVHIIDEKEGWVKVKTEITGWVSSKYIAQ